MGLDEPVEIKLTPEVVAVINATVQRTVTETVADMPTVDQVNTLIERKVKDALKTRPTLQDVRKLLDSEIQELLTAVEEVKKALGEVVALRETITRIDERLNTWVSHRDEAIDEVKADQARIDTAHKEFSATLHTLAANQKQFRDTVYGDASVKDGPPSLMARMQTVEGAKLDNAVFERVFLPVMEFVNVQRLAAQAAQEKRQKRQALVNKVTDMLSVQRVGGLGAAIGAVVKVFIDNF